MKRLLTKIISLTLLAFFTGMSLSGAAAANTQSDQRKVRQAIKQLNQQIGQKKAESSSISMQVTQLEKALGDLSNKQHRTESEIDAAQKRLASAEKRRGDLKQGLKRQQAALAQQLQVMHTVGEQSHLRLLLLQDNPAEISRNVQYFNYLNRYRSQRITDISRTEIELDAMSVAAKKERSELKILKVELQKQQEQVSIKLASRENTLKAVRADLNSKRKRLNKLVSQEKALQREINRIARRAEKKRAEAAAKKAAQRQTRELAARKARDKKRQAQNQHKQQNQSRTTARNTQRQKQQQKKQPTGRKVTTSRTPNKPFSKLRGKLSWPVSGRVIHRYNSRRNEKQRWSGVVIAAPGGAKVRVVAPGKVVFAGWMNGYGHLIIVQHDRSYLSLYGYNRAVFKRVGQRVKADEVIAAVGNSSGQSRNALYFEIRRGTTPQNPARWLR